MEIISVNNTLWENALDGLSVEQREQVENRLEKKHFTDAPIFRQGDSADSIFILKSGRLRLFYMNEEGEEYTTGVWSKGYMSGLISSILQCERLLSAECLGEATIQILFRKDLLMLMEAIPRFGFNIASILARMAMDSIVDSGPLALETASVRLGKTLLKLAKPEMSHPSHIKYCIRGVTQENLAKMVGVSRPWISSILSSFENQGLVERQHRVIILVDKSKLPASWL